MGRPEPSRCYGCGYDLSGLEVPACPECSADLRPEALAGAEERQRHLRETFVDLVLAGLMCVLAAVGTRLSLRGFNAWQSQLGFLLCFTGMSVSCWICVRGVRRRAGMTWGILIGVLVGPLLFAWVTFSLTIIVVVCRLLFGF